MKQYPTTNNEFRKDFTVNGEIKVPSVDTDAIVPLHCAANMTLIGIVGTIGSGTSATVSIQKNGVGLTGLSDKLISTTTAVYECAPIQLEENSKLAPVVTAVSGAPKNMTVTLLFEKQ